MLKYEPQFKIGNVIRSIDRPEDNQFDQVIIDIKISQKGHAYYIAQFTSGHCISSMEAIHTDELYYVIHNERMAKRK